MRLSFITVLLCFFLTVTCQSARADFYVVAIGANGKPVGTEISSIPTTITQPGFYYFTKNLSHTSGAAAIDVQADDVTIDLMGFVLDGNGANADGVSTGNTNVTIRNGTIRSFSNGINLGSTAGSVQVLDAAVLDSSNSGILTSLTGGSVDLTVRNCRVADNARSNIEVYGGHADITGSTISGAAGTAANPSYGWGILFDKFTTGRVVGNRVYGNNDIGITLRDGVLYQNVCSGNGQDYNLDSDVLHDQNFPPVP